MQKELGRVVPIQDVAHTLSRNFGIVFESQILWPDSLDALLGTNSWCANDGSGETAQDS